MKSFLGRSLKIVGIVLLLGASCVAQTTQPDEQALYKLGAFPVARLTEKYWTNGNPGQVYSAGDRVDVDGWLSPHFAPEYLTDAEKKTDGLPRSAMTFDDYLAFIDIDGYKKTHDPTLFIVMRFALDEMRWHPVKIRKDDILKIYEAQVGLEPYTVWLLDGQLSQDDAMRLMQKYRDERLIRILPAPAKEDQKYMVFLADLVGQERWTLRDRKLVWAELCATDGKSYRKPYRDFLFTNIATAKDWADREWLYEGLIDLKDPAANQIVTEALVNDPVTECREQILYHLKENGLVWPEVIDAIEAVSKGMDRTNHPESMNRGTGDDVDAFKEYLTWAKDQPLDAASKTKIDQSLKRFEPKQTADDPAKN